MSWVHKILCRLARLAENPIASALIALEVYGLLAASLGSLWHISSFAYYNYLADAFLHGQLHLRLEPANTRDLILFAGRYYLYWPPLPAILMMPFVAIWGVEFNDVVFTLGVAALNVMLVALMLRQACCRGIIRISRAQRGILVLFFALGTVHITLAPFGRVWFTGQLVGFSCLILAYWAALSFDGAVAFALTGAALGGALLTRNTLVLAGLWPIVYLLHRNRWAGRRLLAKNVLAGLVPLGISAGLLGIYNAVRFGNPLDIGYAYHQMSPEFIEDWRRYGGFNLHYVPINLHYQFIVYPFPLSLQSLNGGSLFLLSPVFFAAFWGLVQGRPRWSVMALAGSIVLTAIPILLLMGTGWMQFGPRYTLDFTVPLLLLTALGIRRWPTWLLGVLALVSIVQFLIGTFGFGWMILNL